MALLRNIKLPPGWAGLSFEEDHRGRLIVSEVPKACFSRRSFGENIASSQMDVRKGEEIALINDVTPLQMARSVCHGELSECHKGASTHVVGSITKNSDSVCLSCDFYRRWRRFGLDVALQMYLRAVKRRLPIVFGVRAVEAGDASTDKDYQERKRLRQSIPLDTQEPDMELDCDLDEGNSTDLPRRNPESPRSVDCPDNGLELSIDCPDVTPERSPNPAPDDSSPDMMLDCSSNKSLDSGSNKSLNSDDEEAAVCSPDVMSLCSPCSPVEDAYLLDESASDQALDDEPDRTLGRGPEGRLCSRGRSPVASLEYDVEYCAVTEDDKIIALLDAMLGQLEATTEEIAMCLGEPIRGSRNRDVVDGDKRSISRLDRTLRRRREGGRAADAEERLSGSECRMRTDDGEDERIQHAEGIIADVEESIREIARDIEERSSGQDDDVMTYTEDRSSELEDEMVTDSEDMSIGRNGRVLADVEEQLSDREESILTDSEEQLSDQEDGMLTDVEELSSKQEDGMPADVEELSSEQEDGMLTDVEELSSEREDRMVADVEVSSCRLKRRRSANDEERSTRRGGRVYLTSVHRLNSRGKWVPESDVNSQSRDVDSRSRQMGDRVPDGKSRSLRRGDRVPEAKSRSRQRGNRVTAANARSSRTGPAASISARQGGPNGRRENDGWDRLDRRDVSGRRNGRDSRDSRDRRNRRDRRDRRDGRDGRDDRDYRDSWAAVEGYSSRNKCRISTNSNSGSDREDRVLTGVEERSSRHGNRLILTSAKAAAAKHGKVREIRSPVSVDAVSSALETHMSTSVDERSRRLKGRTSVGIARGVAENASVDEMKDALDLLLLNVGGFDEEKREVGSDNDDDLTLEIEGDFDEEPIVETAEPFIEATDPSTDADEPFSNLEGFVDSDLDAESSIGAQAKPRIQAREFDIELDEEPALCAEVESIQEEELDIDLDEEAALREEAQPVIGAEELDLDEEPATCGEAQPIIETEELDFDLDEEPAPCVEAEPIIETEELDIEVDEELNLDSVGALEADFQGEPASSTCPKAVALGIVQGLVEDVEEPAVEAKKILGLQTEQFYYFNYY
eukprot:GEMP01003812.1.p1 GENE.GEMP01003812.1~~GEMP01003812.1.p1  ORF type:complete len:1083 (+),score=231.87 GEMP01003812.1:76-3324(+)